MLKKMQNNLLDENYKDRLNNYFNPYNFNFDGNVNKVNNDISCMKTKSHINRKRVNK